MTAVDRNLADVRQEQGSVVLILDDGETFELAPESVPKNLPEIGGRISVPLYAEIRLAAERKQVARRILLSLDRRLQPVARLRGKLLEKGFSLEAIDQVLQKMDQQGLYSDQHYAEAWTRNCLLTKAVGRRYMISKLRQKQIPVAVAQAAVTAELDSETEVELAHRAARTRWRKMSGGLDHKALAKVVRFLLGRGFPPGLAHQAARDNKPDETEPES